MKWVKKILVVILAICIMLWLCSCSNEAAEKKTDNNPLILAVSAQGVTNSKVHGIGDPTEYGLYTASERRQLSDARNTVKSPFNSSKELQYKCSECIFKNSLNAEIGDFYCIYDEYSSGKEDIMLLHDTDIVCFYHKEYNPDESYPLMEEVEVRAIAENFLKSIMSEETFSKFDYKRMSMDALGRYGLAYVRYIEGYPTDETLSVFVDRCGEVSGYNGLNLKKYDTLEDSLTKEQIEKTETYLLRYIDSQEGQVLEKYDPVIVTNTSGELYLSMKFSYQNTDGTIWGETVLTKIE